MASINQLPSGLWRVRITRKGYPFQSKSFRLRADAEGWARTIEANNDRAQWKDRTSADTTTLSALLQDYSREMTPRKRGADVELARISALLRDPIARYKLPALSPVVLAGWRDRRLATGVSGSTVNRELNLLSAVLAWGIKERMLDLPANPCAAVRRPPQMPGRDRRPSDDDRRKMTEALTDASRPTQGPKRSGNYRAGTRNPWVLPMMRFATETGMRRGELCAARWEHVDLDAGTLHLPADITKTRTARTVPLSPAALDVLRTLDRTDDPRIFPTSPSAVTQAWSDARKRAGVQGLRVHDLRHEAASSLFELGFDTMEVAAVTGHKDLRSLKRYTHIDPAHLARKIADLKSHQQHSNAAAPRQGQKKKPS